MEKKKRNEGAEVTSETGTDFVRHVQPSYRSRSAVHHPSIYPSTFATWKLIFAVMVCREIAVSYLTLLGNTLKKPDQKSSRPANVIYMAQFIHMMQIIHTGDKSVPIDLHN